MSETTGTLYLCATPIGNLEDMTPRALRMLREADYIAAEDTRHTRQLLTHFEIHGTLISYHEHNKEKQGSLLLEYLRSGKNIALVSDAGFPGISDPGELIAKQCIDEGIPVVPVPVPTRPSRRSWLRALRARRFSLAASCRRAKRTAAKNWKNGPIFRRLWCSMKRRTASKKYWATSKRPGATAA